MSRIEHFAVYADDPTALKDFCAKESLGFKLLADVDRKVSSDYGSTMEYNGTPLAARNTFIIGPDYDPIRKFEVADGRALAEELRIRHDRHIHIGTFLVDDTLDLITSTNRHGRLGYNNSKPFKSRSYLPRRFVNKRKIGMAIVPPRWRPYSNEHSIGGSDWLAKIR